MRWEQLVQPGQYTGNTGKSPHSSMHWQICRNAKKHADSSNSWLAEKLISTGTVSPVFALTFSSYSSSTMLPPCRLLPPRAHPSYSDSSQLLHLQQCWVLSCLSALTFPGPLRDILRITACVVPFPPLSRPSTRSLCIVTGGGHKAQSSITPLVYCLSVLYAPNRLTDRTGRLQPVEGLCMWHPRSVQVDHCISWISPRILSGGTVRPLPQHGSITSSRPHPLAAPGTYGIVPGSRTT